MDSWISLLNVNLLPKWFLVKIESIFMYVHMCTHVYRAREQHWMLFLSCQFNFERRPLIDCWLSHVTPSQALRLNMCTTTTSNLLCGFWKIELRALGGASGIYWLSHHHSVPEIGSETLKTNMTLFEAILYACGFRHDKLYHSCVARSPRWFCLYLHVEDCWPTRAISKVMGGSSLFSVSFPMDEIGYVPWYGRDREIAKITLQGVDSEVPYCYFHSEVKARPREWKRIPY